MPIYSRMLGVDGEERMRASYRAPSQSTEPFPSYDEHSPSAIAMAAAANLRDISDDWWKTENGRSCVYVGDTGIGVRTASARPVRLSRRPLPKRQFSTRMNGPSVLETGSPTSRKMQTVREETDEDCMMGAGVKRTNSATQKETAHLLGTTKTRTANDTSFKKQKVGSSSTIMPVPATLPVSTAAPASTVTPISTITSVSTTSTATPVSNPNLLALLNAAMSSNNTLNSPSSSLTSNTTSTDPYSYPVTSNAAHNGGASPEIKDAHYKHLRLQLAAAEDALVKQNQVLAKKDEELSQMRITSLTFNQLISDGPSPIKSEGASRVVGGLPNSFNVASRPISGRMNTWPTQPIQEDNRSASDLGDGIPAAFARTQQIWGTTSAAGYSSMNVTSMNTMTPALAMSSGWNGANTNPQIPSNPIELPSYVDMLNARYNSSATIGSRRPDSGGLGRNGWDPRPITPMSSVSASTVPNMVQYGQNGTIRSRLSPTASEFSYDGMSAGPWNPQPTQQIYVSPSEPINYRRLLDRNMSCNWGYIVDKIIHHNDQQASIFLQQKLKLGTNAQKIEIINSIIAKAYPLMVNRFGNFLVQRCFEHGTADQVVDIAKAIIGNTLTLSMDAFGCHVVQKAFDCVPEEFKVKMVSELLQRIKETVVHRYACHVWQKLFELRWTTAPPMIMKYVNNALKGVWHEVALGETGSLVVQNIFENCLEEDKRPCIDEVIDNIDVVAKGQFGNWCIQHICEHGSPLDRHRAVQHILAKAADYSMDQYASKVIEKCLKIGGKEFLEHYLDRVTEGTEERPRMPLIDIAGDQFGNYLIQWILIHATPRLREIVEVQINKHMVSLRGSKYGARVALLAHNPENAIRPGAPTINHHSRHIAYNGHGHGHGHGQGYSYGNGYGNGQRDGHNHATSYTHANTQSQANGYDRNNGYNYANAAYNYYANGYYANGYGHSNYSGQANNANRYNYAGAWR